MDSYLLSSTFWDVFISCLNPSTTAFNELTRHIPIKKTYKTTTECLAVLQKLESQVTELNFFHKDELVDDFSTQSLRYLLIPFLRGQCLENTNAPELRHGALLTAKLQYSLFVHEVCWYGRERQPFIAAQEEFENFLALYQDGADRHEMAAESRRTAVITRRRRIQELQQTMMDTMGEVLQEFKSVEQRQASDTVQETRGDSFDFWIACLERAVLDSITSVDLIQQELPLLIRFNNKENAVDSEEHVCRLDGAGKILTKPFILKISNSAELKRLYASQVFQPGHILPTVSLAEAGAFDMNIEVERLQAAQKRTLKENDESSMADEEAEEVRPAI